MTKKCCICGNDIPEKRLKYDTCCRSCATKKAWQKPGYKEKMSKIMTSPEVKSKIVASVKLAYQNPEYHKKLSKAQLNRFQNKEKYDSFVEAMNKPSTKLKLSIAIKKKFNDEQMKQKLSQAQQRRFQNEEQYKAFVQTMNKPETKEKLRNKMKSYETQKKINDTKRANGSLNSSKEENKAYEALLTLFSKVERQYYCKRYPYKCDFYLPEKDIFIECHFSWLHNGKVFDKNSLEHLKEVEAIRLDEQRLSMKRPDKENMYTVKLYTWTDLDVRKFECAKQNKLNWLCFYSYNDFNEWLRGQYNA